MFLNILASGATVSADAVPRPLGGEVSAEAVTDDPRKMLRLKDASPLLDVPVSTLRRLCAAGRVPAEKVGRGWRVKRAYVDEVTAWARERAS
jgi:excisionase family DNA binding protein